MVFPFSISYNEPLKITVTPANKQQILEYIEKCILEDKADNVVIEDMQVTYKGSTSRWNGALFRSVDDGIFNLLYIDDRWSLNYQINMRNLFIITAIMSTVMGVFALLNDGPWWIGIVAFLWLCGANWIISLIRHSGVAATIAFGIDELILGKPEIPEEDKMTGKLKSWF